MILTKNEKRELWNLFENGQANGEEMIDAVIAEVVRKLVAGVSVEPFAYTDPLFVSVRQLGGFFTASNDKVGMFTVPLYTATALAAARVQAIRDCEAAIKSSTKGGGNSAHEVGLFAALDAIRALLGKEQS